MILAKLFTVLLVMPLMAPAPVDFELMRASLDGVSYNFILRELVNDCSRRDACTKGQTWLNIDKGLTDWQYNNVNNVVVTEYSLPRIPIHIFHKFSRLKSFQMTNQNVSFLEAEDFDGGRYVTTLNLSLNGIKSLDFNVFDSARTLKVLDLSHNRIGAISNVDSIVLDFEELYLSHNQLIEFESYGVLSKIKRLTLNNNRLTKLNSDVNFYNDESYMRAFESFDASHNPLGDFPSLTNKSYGKNQVFSKALNLSYLGLKSLYIRSVTIILRADHNKIAKIMFASDENYAALKELHLSDNQLASFAQFKPYDFSGMLLLDLSHNLFERIEHDAFRQMKNLRELRLDHNRLTSIADSFRSTLTSIQLIELSSNPLEGLRFAKLPRSTLHLGIAEIGLSDIDAAIKQDLPNLKSVRISGNNMNCSYFMFKSLKLHSADIKVNLTGDFNAVLDSCEAHDDAAGRTEIALFNSTEPTEIDGTLATEETTSAEEVTEVVDLGENRILVEILDSKLTEAMDQIQMEIMKIAELFNRKFDNLSNQLKRSNSNRVNADSRENSVLIE